MVKKETQEKIQQLQMLEQNLQSFLEQKQQFQAQQLEIESALAEIKDKKEAYKIVGNIMVKSSKEDIVKDLQKKREMADLRVSAIEKQEEKLKEKAATIQKEVMGLLKEE